MSDQKICPSCNHSNPRLVFKCQKCGILIAKGALEATANSAPTFRSDVQSSAAVAPTLRPLLMPAGGGKTCPSCGKDNPRLVKVCQHCKVQLDATAVAKAPNGAPSSPLPADGALLDLYRPQDLTPTPSSAVATAPAQIMPALPEHTVTLSARAPASAHRTTRRRVTRYVLFTSAAAILTLLGFVLYHGIVRRTGKDAVMASVVQIRCGRWSGSGFLASIPGHEDATYVVTARHVIASGDPVSVVRWFGAEGSDYPVTYNEVRVAASDPRSDLAILRLNHVPRGVIVRPLPIKFDDIKIGGAEIYGYRGTGLNDKHGLNNAAIQADITNLSDRPYLDPDNPGHVIQHNAAKTLIMLTGVTKGNSGGPVVHYKSVLGIPIDGEVIGVVSRGDEQNKQTEATSISELKGGLLDQLNPIPVTDATVQARIREIVSKYFHASPTEYQSFVEHVALSDMPHLQQNAHEFAHALSRGLLPGTREMNIALRKIDVSPGDFAAVEDEALRRQIEQCARRDLGAVDATQCESPLQRAFAQDLMKSLLRFHDNLGPESYVVTGVASFSREEGIWSAAVSVTGSKTTFTIRVKESEGKIWVLLFDEDGTPTIVVLDNESPQLLAGEWTAQSTTLDGGRIKEDLGMSIEVRGAGEKAALLGKIVTKFTLPAAPQGCDSDVVKYEQTFIGITEHGRGRILSEDGEVTPKSCEGIFATIVRGLHRDLIRGISIVRADGTNKLRFITNGAKDVRVIPLQKVH